MPQDHSPADPLARGGSRPASIPPASAAPFPFAAIVGQEEMKLALLIAAVDPAIGGVLVFGDRGTGKSTAVRALAALLPQMAVVEGCRFHCDPAAVSSWCSECRGAVGKRAAREPVRAGTGGGFAARCN